MKDQVFSLNFFALKLGLLTLGIFAFNTPVSAGGFELDDAGNSQIDYVEIEITRRQRREQAQQERERMLDWEEWSNSYMDGENICRENNGNIVCLSAESVQHLGW